MKAIIVTLVTLMATVGGAVALNVSPAYQAKLVLTQPNLSGELQPATNVAQVTAPANRTQGSLVYPQGGSDTESQALQPTHTPQGASFGIAQTGLEDMNGNPTILPLPGTQPIR